MFAVGTINASVSGASGNKTITYSYSVDSSPTTAKTGFYTTSTANSYSLTFNPASGSSATIYFYESITGKLLDSVYVTINGGGIPSSFETTVDLGVDKFVSVIIKSNSSSNASSRFTIKGVEHEIYIN